MDQILKNFNNLEWWFTGLFFTVITMLINILVNTWLPYLWNLLAKIIPQLKHKCQRWKKRSTLMIVMHNRQHVVKVNSLISRYWSLASVFALATIFQIIYYIPENFSIDKSNGTMQLIAFIAPIYLFYLISYNLLMLENDVLKAVIKAHIKWQKHIASKDRSRVAAT